MLRIPHELDLAYCCPHCAAVCRLKRATDDHFQCQDCGNQVALQHLRTLVRRSRDATRFAYVYRRVSEKDLAKGELEKRAYLLKEPPNWLVWCGVAALSGIVGNLAYDAVKALIRRLAKLGRSDASFPAIQQELQSDDGIDRFIRYLREFAKDQSTADPKVQARCLHEQCTDPLLTQDAFLDGMEGKLTYDEFRARSDQAFAEITKPESLRPEDWSKLFSKVPVLEEDGRA